MATKSKCDAVIQLVMFLGFITLSKLVLRLLIWVWSMFLRPPKNLRAYGSWALVTGSTDGIGKALSFALASKGLNLVLVGRNPEKLAAVSAEIRASSGEKVETKNVVLDLATRTGEEIATAITAAIEGLDVGIVVNNAGLAYPYARFFHEVDADLMESIVKVNVEAATWVTKAVLPVMMKKKKGAIVNIGSASSGFLPSYPLYSIYAATKGYLAMFSKCTSLEYKKQGIDIQCQIPLLVATKMAKVKTTPFFVPSPEMYSKASLRWVGYDQICIPYWSHAVQWVLLRALPATLVDRYIFDYFCGMRQRCMSKEPMKPNVNN